MTTLGNPFAGMLDIDGVPISDDRLEELQLTLPLTEREQAELVASRLRELREDIVEQVTRTGEGDDMVSRSESVGAAGTFRGKR